MLLAVVSSRNEMDMARDTEVIPPEFTLMVLQKRKIFWKIDENAAWHPLKRSFQTNKMMALLNFHGPSFHFPRS